MKHFKSTPKTMPLRRQGGFTLVELLVSMGLGLLVIAIAGGALLLGRQGFDAVDSGTQLRDKQRLAVDILTRTIVQAGFEDYAAAAAFRADFKEDTTSLEPDIFGWNNAIYAAPGIDISATTAITNGNRPGKCGSVTDTSCRNGSDILVVRYQGITSPTNSAKSDNSMINCGGWGEKGLITKDLNERGASLFHVAAVNGEPSLYCAYYKHATNEWSDSTPLIEGVESFQVLYGTDRVTPTTAPPPNIAPKTVDEDPLMDSVAERWLRADQLTVVGNPKATRDNWRRVRAVRIGLVLRGPVGSAQQSAATTLTPLGVAYTDSVNDTGSALAVLGDRRLRIPGATTQAGVTLPSAFTVHVRNDLTTR
ncbi:MAG: PilW family protein [Burkholderiaceae bacterium]